nr:unnamed protein product [Ananas comosus var. bracteatus]
MPSSLLAPAQSRAAAALLALALGQAQLDHSRPRNSAADDGGGGGGGDPSDLWTHESHALLRPVFHHLGIDPDSWAAIEETAASSCPRDRIAEFLKIIFDNNETSSERSEEELALSKAIDSIVASLKTASGSTEVAKEEQSEHKDNSDKRFTSDMVHKISELTSSTSEIIGQLSDDRSMLSMSAEMFDLTKIKVFFGQEAAINKSTVLLDNKSIIVDFPVSDQRKLGFLYELLSACVADIPDDDKKSSQHRKGYDARHRIALRILAGWLDVQWINVEAMEIMLACSAIAAAKEALQSEGCQSEESSWSRWKRGGIIGAAALTGGAMLAISGGLAAPAIAAGFSALAPTLGTLVPFIGAGGFATAAGAAGSVTGSVAVAASFGAAGAGLSGTKMAKRIGSIEEFEFKNIGENHNQGRLAVSIFVSGFVCEEKDYVDPWEQIEVNSERYALQWESKNLIALSTATQEWFTSTLTTELMRQGAMMTVLSTLVSAIAWPTALLSATDFIDSKWSIAIDRSDKAGKLLAEALLKGLQGNRPVTLVGFSLGARVIFECLQQLAKSKDNEGIIEKVVLLGAPIPLKADQWESARKIVAGKFVNVFSTNDWILGLTFRASLMTQGLAGIQAVEVPGVENVDVSNLVDGHSAYLQAASKILQQLAS